MKIISSPLEFRCGSNRRTVFLDKVVMDTIESFQVAQLTKTLDEPYHTNKDGSVLCFVVQDWMEAHCVGENHRIEEGQGIIFESNERHRINKGEGWMLSLSTKNYDTAIKTEWETK